ncbi:hypothetical protein C7M84_009516 [Penaeus vannamei]|uniref:Uncharacterized protein n=1 Tax=Penaeus vannamei TaxID=6689 RepID=A0A423T6I8_PENVA|nr:uncharacterized protein LOC113811319 [Penaeus vannamei]ROT72114.1 hypothetical protein C7M84_009516 [Penaeus vannamei]
MAFSADEFTVSCSETEGMRLYELLTKVIQRDEDKKIQVLSIGPANDKEVVSVLLLGETGAGKTRLINALLNIVFGVQLADDFRFVLKDQMDLTSKSQIHSQTDYITAYLIHHMDGMLINNNLMIIDTPGFGDTRGVEYQNRVMERLSFFLLNDFGIDNLHCIGLVAKANQTRISRSQINILNAFSSLLSHDVTPITKLLATFASDDNHVHEVVKSAGINFSSVYEFDNWPLYITRNNTDRRSSLNHEYRWDNMQEKNLRFLRELSAVPPVSLKSTRQLQADRRLLAETKAKLKDEVKREASLTRAHDKLKTEMNKLLEKAEKIKWKYNEKYVSYDRCEVESGFHTHNCKICKKTCETCRDPSNIRAGIVGTTTGVGTGVATGIFSAMISGVVIGAEVGLFGGPVGATIGSSIGAASALTSGLIAGIRSRKTKFECPLASSDRTCEKNGCSHKMSEHEIGSYSITESENWTEKVNLLLKAKYDELINQSRKTESLMKEKEEQIHGCRVSLKKKAMKVVNNIKAISELSLESDSLTQEKFLEETIAEVKDLEEVRILRTIFSDVA